MFKQFIEILECPACHEELKWHILEENEVRIINADISCTSCRAKYEVRDEIAVFFTPDLVRNDLWEKGESGLIKYLRENPDIFEKLMNTPEEELNGADYWYKAAYYEMKGDYNNSTKMYENAFEKIYTKAYIQGWDSQMNYILEHVKEDKPVVDIASGKGYLVEKLLRETNNPIVATDFSPTILIRNKEYYTFKGLYDRLSLIAFDARRTPFKNDSIDIMTSNLGIQNIEHPGAVIDEMNRITKSEFMTIMQFISEEDTVNMKLMNEFGTSAYATKSNALDTFGNNKWSVSIENSFIAQAKPTPKGEILDGAGIDGFPVEDTEIDFCVIHTIK